MINQWFHKWLIKFNPDKCKLLQLDNSSPTNYYLHSPNECFRSLISRATEEKDLARRMVYKWNKIITPSSKGCTCIAKAMQTLVLGMMKRSFEYLSNDSFLFLYETYIRPHLEYCAPTWSPKDIDALERAQHCHGATKLVKKIWVLLQHPTKIEICVGCYDSTEEV